MADFGVTGVQLAMKVSTTSAAIAGMDALKITLLFEAMKAGDLVVHMT